MQIHLERIAPDASLYATPTPADHMVPVAALRCDHRGVSGITASDELQPDVHHRDHPHSRYRTGNDISLMATGHYERMRDRFGEHMTDGIAGENVLIDFDGVLSLDDLAPGLVIGDGDDAFPIDAWRIAMPCAPFSRFASRVPADEKPDKRVTNALRFLNNGMRGFYGAFPDDMPAVEIRAGDIFYMHKT